MRKLQDLTPTLTADYVAQADAHAERVQEQIDKAEKLAQAFVEAVAEIPENSEIHWGILLKKAIDNDPSASSKVVPRLKGGENIVGAARRLQGIGHSYGQRRTMITTPRQPVKSLTADDRASLREAQGRYYDMGRV